METARISYEFEAAYVYAPGERYNAGRGLQFFTDDKAHALGVMETFKHRAADGEIYAICVRELPAGTVIATYGPSIAAANASMRAALTARRNTVEA